MDETSTVAESAALPPRTGAPSRGTIFGADLVGEGSWVSLAVWAVLFLGPLAVLITAATLTPSTAGHGTHTQLGLPPCGFLVYTGYPCPGCGLTTSFSHMIRLEVFGAFHANPFGILLFGSFCASMEVVVFGHRIGSIYYVRQPAPPEKNTRGGASSQS